MESVQMGRSESVTSNRSVKSLWRADYKRVVKSYSRPAAGHGPPAPEDIRPPQVLLKTDRYLISELCEEPPSHFDATIHGRHLLECVQRLLILYDWWEREDGRDAAACPGRADIEALYLVLAPGSVDALLRAVQLPPEYRSFAVEGALAFSLSCYSGNYVRALRRLPRLPPLAAGLATLHLPHLRRQALRVMSVAYSSRNLRYPSAALADLFLAGSTADIVDECRYYGLNADVDAGVAFDKNSFDHNVRVRTPVRLKVVDEKLAAADITKLLLGDAA